MRLCVLCAVLVLAGIGGCGSNPPAPSHPAIPAVITHTYNGTASVGDFLTITLNTTALTITYSNLSNGDGGTFPYTVNADGSYTLNDPKGNLLSAYEIPGYALLIEAAKAGPAHDTPALITAVETGPITLSTFSGKSYNYMQFRTASGGLEVGSVSISGTAGANSSYWPYGSFADGSEGAFHNGTLDFSQMKDGSSGTYLYGPDDGGGTGNDYVFGTASGFFIVDTPNGSIIGLPKAATPAFDPSVAGTYSAVFYQKTNAQTGMNNVETGTSSTSCDGRRDRGGQHHGHRHGRQHGDQCAADSRRQLRLFVWRRGSTERPLQRAVRLQGGDRLMGTRCVRYLRRQLGGLREIQCQPALVRLQRLQLLVWRGIEVENGPRSGVAGPLTALVLKLHGSAVPFSAARAFERNNQCRRESNTPP